MKKMLMVLMMAMVIGFYSQSALAQEIYKWVDEKGTTHFTDHTPETVKSSINPENVATQKRDELARQKGDELARQRILKEAQQPKLKLPETSYYDAHPEERNQGKVVQKKQVDFGKKLRQMESAQQRAIDDAERKMKSMQEETERKLKSEMDFQKMDMENQIRMNEMSKW